MGKEGVVVAAGILAVMTVMAGVTAAVFMASRVDTLAHREYNCEYLPSPAVPLGVAAMALSLMTQVLANTVIGCCRAWQIIPGQTRRIVAILLFVGSWVLTIKVVILFMMGTMLGLGGYMRNLIKNNNCIATGVGVFMAATILFLIVVSLDIATYTLVQKGVLHTENTIGLEMPPSGILTDASGVAKC